MNSKKTVRFSKTVRTDYLFQRLRQCSRCGSYTSLEQEDCSGCGSRSSWMTLPKPAEAAARQRGYTDMLVIGILAAAGVIVARSFTEIAAALAGGLILIAGYAKIRHAYEPYIFRRTLSRLLLQEHEQIRLGLLQDIDKAETALKGEDFKTAYEKFREIGYFIPDNPIRLLKLMCLGRFILRSDMELELTTLIPNRFDTDFTAYLLDVGRIKPRLIERPAIDYVVKYRSEIERLPYGAEILTAAAGAALRIKSHLLQYRGLVLDYIDLLPDERLQRLQRLAAELAADHPELLQRVQQAASRRSGGSIPAGGEAGPAASPSADPDAEAGGHHQYDQRRERL
ncbi:hypothetical protein SAMN02799630_03814 [Paenibacillus sp. UNCCL117]|uniref:hypothetical protein n=1 Tax=unclassified Paenibacillus TaxID=185978 RepID=UPI000883CEAD|nr:MULTISPECIES: hypothetical protein [unclassified Paenibacillus]SDD59104.1 hypothetical protein SAMN04488602_110123 [Paenibacillus sp. cl123]SFW50881.1 hypothetical protein SAMN02799630_03814 [Paenibacillus sp. UNCCL117]